MKNNKLTKKIIIIAILSILILITSIVIRNSFKQIDSKFKFVETLEESVKFKESSLKPLVNDIKMIRPEKNEFITGENKVTFMGMADPSNVTTYNGIAVDVSKNGNFIIDFNLKEGVNAISLLSGGKEVKYKIIKENKIIQSISPKEKIKCDIFSNINISAKLYSGCEAYVIIDNKKIDLMQNETNDFISARATSYANFIGTLDIDENMAGKNLGRIKIVAKYNGIIQEALGGEIVVNTNNNINKVIRIKSKDAKVYDTKNLDVTPLIEKIPLCENTKDIIKSEVCLDNRKYYILQSNRRIKVDDAIVINESINRNNEVTGINIYQDDKYTKIIVNGINYSPYNFKLIEEATKVGSGKIEITLDYINKIKCLIESQKNELFKECIIDETKNTIVLSLKDDTNVSGYRSYFDKGNLVLEFLNKINNLNKMTVVIDPGHGITQQGFDSGALGYSDINEHTLNVEMAKILEEKLLNKGVTVHTLDTDNEFIPLQERGKKGKEYCADLFISIHNNSGGSGYINATETYYFTPFSKSIAQDVNRNLVNAYTKIFGDENKEKYDRGYKFNDFTVTLERECPSILIEVGYVDNPISFEKLCNNYYQEILMNSVVKGIGDSFE